MSPADLFAVTALISMLLTAAAVMLADRDDDRGPMRTA